MSPLDLDPRSGPRRLSLALAHLLAYPQLFVAALASVSLSVQLKEALVGDCRGCAPTHLDWGRGHGSSTT